MIFKTKASNGADVIVNISPISLANPGPPPIGTDYYLYNFNHTGSGQIVAWNMYPALRQNTSDPNWVPTAGAGLYVAKYGNPPSVNFYIGLATIAQATLNPTNPAGWETYVAIPFSSLPSYQYSWVSFYFTDPSSYINLPDLCPMIFTDIDYDVDNELVCGISTVNGDAMSYNPSQSAWEYFNNRDLVFFTLKEISPPNAKFVSASCYIPDEVVPCTPFSGKLQFTNNGNSGECALVMTLKGVQTELWSGVLESGNSITLDPIPFHFQKSDYPASSVEHISFYLGYYDSLGNLVPTDVRSYDVFVYVEETDWTKYVIYGGIAVGVGIILYSVIKK